MGMSPGRVDMTDRKSPAIMWSIGHVGSATAQFVKTELQRLHWLLAGNTFITQLSTKKNNKRQMTHVGHNGSEITRLLKMENTTFKIGELHLQDHTIGHYISYHGGSGLMAKTVWVSNHLIGQIFMLQA